MCTPMTTSPHVTRKLTLFLCIAGLSLACQPAPHLNAQTSNAPNPQPEAAVVTPNATAPAPDMKASTVAVDQTRYPWLAEWPGALPQFTTVQTRFPAPDGFSRVTLDKKSFGHWLRGLPVRLDRAHVLSWQGERLDSPSAGVIALDLGKRDLQQCADSAIRLHAEFAWATGARDGIGYHFTSGYRSTWTRWRRGERFRPKGRDVEPYMGKARKNNHTAFRGWLQHLFRYAGTRSLRFDSDAVAAGDLLQPGDFLVQPGGPGHAVLILDVAVHQDDPERRIALIGQGFMPAQDFHVVQSPHKTLNHTWFPLPALNAPAAKIDTPSWRPFARSEARRFKRVKR